MPAGWDELFEGQQEKPSINIDSMPDGSRIVVVSDSQVPMEDRALLHTIFDKFVPEFKPTARRAQYHLFLNGDIIDAFNLSSFLQRVQPRFTLGDEVVATRRYLERWGKDFTHKHFVFGNHEDRWDRELYAGNPKLAFATRRLHEVLELSDLGYDWVPYLRHYNVLGFVITHGDLVREHTAAGMLKNYQTSGVSGHTNRPQSHGGADAIDGEANMWYIQGMTCRPEIGDIIKDFRRIQPWQQGFLIGEVRDGVLYVENVTVHHGRFYASGKIYTIRQ